MTPRRTARRRAPPVHGSCPNRRPRTTARTTGPTGATSARIWKDTTGGSTSGFAARKARDERDPRSERSEGSSGRPAAHAAGARSLNFSMPTRSIHQSGSATRRPASETGRGAERVHAGGRRLSFAGRVHLPVLERVPYRVGGLPRRSEQLRVVAVGKHRALPVHDLVERARHPDLEPLHRPAQRLRVGSLDDEVRVVALHREVHQAEPEPLAAALERAPECAKATMRAEVPDLATDADCDVQRALAKLAANPMRNVLARRHALASGAAPRASPLPERELLLQLLLAGSIDGGSDIPGSARRCRRTLARAMSALSSRLRRSFALPPVGDLRR